MSDPHEVMRRTRVEKRWTLTPEDLWTLQVSHDVTIQVDMLDKTVIVDGPPASEWTVTDQRRKRSRNS